VTRRILPGLATSTQAILVRLLLLQWGLVSFRGQNPLELEGVVFFYIGRPYKLAALGAFIWNGLRRGLDVILISLWINRRARHMLGKL
jgi:hypothetical protein